MQRLLQQSAQRLSLCDAMAGAVSVPCAQQQSSCDAMAYAVRKRAEQPQLCATSDDVMEQIAELDTGPCSSQGRLGVSAPHLDVPVDDAVLMERSHSQEQLPHNRQQ